MTVKNSQKSWIEIHSDSNFIKDLFFEESPAINSFVNTLVKEKNIQTNAIVEFGIGNHLKIARAFSKYSKVYYANSYHGREYWEFQLPKKINGMKIIPLVCDALDVEGNFDVAVYNDVFWTLNQSSRYIPEDIKFIRNKAYAVKSLVYRTWLVNVRNELREDKFDTLLKYKEICPNDISCNISFIENDKEENLRNLDRRLAGTPQSVDSEEYGKFKKPCYTFFIDSVFVNYTPCIILDKVYQMLNQNGTLLIFEKSRDSYGISVPSQIIGKMQKQEFKTFQKVEIINVPESTNSEMTVLYAQKN